MTHAIVKFARSFAYPLALLVGLVIFPDSSSQWEFGIVLFLSLWLMAWFGHAALHVCAGDGPLLHETLFLKACLGQFFLLIMWLLVSPVIFIIKEVINLPLALPLLVAASIVAMALRARAARLSFLRSLQYDDIGRIAFTLFAAACLFKVGAYYSVRAGALGLDTHQHIYFAADLFDAGYLKLNAGTTSWIERYPKGLHALTALWGLPGLGDHLGPSLKIMPSLQVLLVVFSFVELCAIWLRRCDAQRLIMSGWWLLIAIGLAYVLFRGTRFVYPRADLNSTARLSSAAVLFLPGIVGCLMLLQSSRRMAVLASIALPFAGALSVKFNPVLATAFFAVSVPLWIATAGWAVARDRRTWGAAALGLLGGGVIGVVLIVTDPFYLGLVASASHTAASLLQASTGLMLLPQAASMISALPQSIAPMGLAAAIWHNLSIPDASIAFHALPDSAMVLSGKLMAGIRALSWSVLGLWFLGALFWRRRTGQTWPEAAMPALVQVALLVGVWADGVLGRAVAEVVGAITVEASVLSTYAREFSNILVLFSVPVHLALSAALLIQLCSRFAKDWTSRWAVRGAAFAVVLLAVSLRWWPLPEAPLAEKLGWWHPVKEAQLDAFQHLEQAVPEDAIVLADATAAKLNEREEWILPAGEAAAYLAAARRRYVFNVRLGDGYAFSFADLDSNFCHGTPETARRFLKQNNVRYLFAVDRSATTREQVFGKNYCGIKYFDLGVVYPPLVVGRDGMAIYELKLN